MSETGDLMETIAAAILDGMTVSFAPRDDDGTRLPTGIVVGVRHGAPGRTHGSTREVGLSELVMSGAGEKVLTEAITDTIEPVALAALTDHERWVR